MGFSFKSMRKSMTQIQQGALPCLALISFDNARFSGTGRIDRMGDCRLVKRQHIFAVCFQPFKKVTITKQSIFDDFGETGTQFARRQAGQKCGIGKHGFGLIERADQIFTFGRINASLATDRAIDLCQKRCWYLHKINTAQQAGRRKASQITNNAAAKSN